METLADRICLDTTLLVDLLRNKPAAIQWVTGVERHAHLATTQINAFELYYGAHKSTAPNQNLAATEKLLQRLTLLPMSRESALHAGELLARLEKQGKTIEFRDLFIGSIAMVEGFRLKTENKKHFERMSGLVLEP